MILIVAELRVPPAEQAAVVALATEHAARSRSEPGCELYELLIDPAVPGRICFTEGWHDEAALRAHAKAAGSRAFAEAVGRIEGVRMDARLFDAAPRAAR